MVVQVILDQRCWLWRSAGWRTVSICSVEWSPNIQTRSKYQFELRVFLCALSPFRYVSRAATNITTLLYRIVSTSHHPRTSMEIVMAQPTAHVRAITGLPQITGSFPLAAKVNRESNHSAPPPPRVNRELNHTQTLYNTLL